MDRGSGDRTIHPGDRPTGDRSRLRSALLAVATIAGLAGLAFGAGILFGNYQQGDDRVGGQTAASETTPAVADQDPSAETSDAGTPADDAGEAAAPENSDDASSDTGSTDGSTDPPGDDDAPLGPEAGPRLRFAAFAEPIALIDGDTDPALNNSAGVDLDQFASQDGAAGPPAAVVADLLVTGPAGTAVAIHPGDRPTDAVRFSIPGSGKLLVQHLLVVPDADGRVSVSADDQVTVELDGYGRYLPAEQASAGRFVPTDSVRVGSLVTATDGRTLTIDLTETIGDEAAHVGQAVLRLNANVGPDGGSVSVGSGEPIPWAAPAVPDLALAGTELLTVTPDDDGQIVMDYQGGSVLTVDLVGYYTNDSAPESTDGLLVLASRPALQTVEIGGDATSVGTDADLLATAGLGGVDHQGTVVVIELANGEVSGTVRLWGEATAEPTDPAFALAPGQQRSTAAWLALASGDQHLIGGPAGAVAQIWTLGVYT